MKISYATKAKFGGGIIIFLGLLLFAFAVFEIWSGKIELGYKYGGRKVFAIQQPFYFWARLVFEFLTSLIIMSSGGVLVFKYKLLKKY